MRKTSMALALLATTAVFTPMVHAAGTLAPSSASVTATVTPTSVTFNFTGMTLAGFQFQQLAGDLAGPIFGTLTSVSVNATLDASVGYTYGDDLSLYVVSGELAFGGQLQIGGFSDLQAAEHQSWANGGSSAPGTTVIDTVTLGTPLTFTGGASDPNIWLGNGYGSSSAEGTWSGSITLTGLSATAPVPEPSSMALMLGGLGLAGFVARRRRARSA